MAENARVALLVAFATVASFFLFRGTSGTARRADVEDAVPRGAFLVATLEVEKLRTSPVIDAVLGTDKNRALGTSAIRDACGFDPIARVRRASISVPEDESDRGAFGLAATVDVTSDELQRCVAKLSAEKGARATTRESGSFVVLDREAPGVGASGKRPPAQIAYGKGGLLLVGQGAWLEAMMKAADGKGETIATDEAHAAMRRALARREEGEPLVPALATVTMVLPRTLRDRLRGEMADEARANEGATMMRAVLAVSSAGLVVRAYPDGTLGLRALFVCEGEDEAAQLVKLYERSRLDASRDLGMRLVGVSALVDGLRLARAGSTLELTGSFRSDVLASTLERVMRLRGGPKRPGAPPGQAGPPGLAD